MQERSRRGPPRLVHLPWYRRPSILLSFFAAFAVLVLLAGYGVWTANGGMAVDEIVVTGPPRGSTPAPPAREPAQVAAGQQPEAPDPETADAAAEEPETGELVSEEDVVPERPRSSYTVIPDLLLRAEPSLDAIAHRQLELSTPIELVGGTAEADGYDWVQLRLEDGLVGWVIAEGAA